MTLRQDFGTSQKTWTHVSILPLFHIKNTITKVFISMFDYLIMEAKPTTSMNVFEIKCHIAML
jgi:hypothetical protein